VAPKEYSVGKKRRKPRGKIGVVTLGRNPAYHAIHLPETKPEIEHAILRAALATARRQGNDPYALVRPPEQNIENDFDFTLTTRTGTAFLDLLEVAPLEDFGGSYENVPQILRVGDIASSVYSLIRRKHNKYQGIWQTPIHLLAYTTDWRLALPPSALTLLAHWLRSQPHGFASVSYFLPGGILHPLWWSLYPSDDEDLVGLDENEFMERRAARIDPSTIHKTSKGETTFGYFRFDATNFTHIRLSNSGHTEFSKKLEPPRSDSNEPSGGT